jgi:hypothetical protein
MSVDPSDYLDLTCRTPLQAVLHLRKPLLLMQRLRLLVLVL